MTIVVVEAIFDHVDLIWREIVPGFHVNDHIFRPILMPPSLATFLTFQNRALVSLLHVCNVTPECRDVSCWQITTGCSSCADRRYRGIADMAGPEACPAQLLMTE